jgi:RNA polymerase sigma-70 factor (ECF subfamily)
MADSLTNALEVFKMVAMKQAAPLDQCEDGALVALTLSGNGKAFEVLIRRYQKLVYNVLFQMLQNHDTAADVTQETFIRAYRGLSGFRQGHKFKPWLLKVATNAGLNQIRQSEIREFESLDAVLDENPAAEPASRENLEEELDRRFSQAMLVDALRSVSPHNRHVFVLRYQHDLPYAEIAEIVGEPETTIKSTLHRVRERLRKILSQKIQT